MSADKRNINSGVDLSSMPAIGHNTEQEKRFTDFTDKPGPVNKRLMLKEVLKNCTVTNILSPKNTFISYMHKRVFAKCTTLHY